ncbi:hypothetical protein L2E82_23051 [Cichorium intybus]|uniref:Uncharacterized protein n=1 Tax=Cichorium intybus TaxID=13427 RepID=A0ACB9DZG2_CICIN|nr:hypothetical protein L2E82_23051 [Cichorium intybus]
MLSLGQATRTKRYEIYRKSIEVYFLCYPSPYSAEKLNHGVALQEKRLSTTLFMLAKRQLNLKITDLLLAIDHSHEICVPDDVLELNYHRQQLKKNGSKKQNEAVPFEMCDEKWLKVNRVSSSCINIPVKKFELPSVELNAKSNRSTSVMDSEIYISDEGEASENSSMEMIEVSEDGGGLVSLPMIT